MLGPIDPLNQVHTSIGGFTVFILPAFKNQTSGDRQMSHNWTHPVVTESVKEQTLTSRPQTEKEHLGNTARSLPIRMNWVHWCSIQMTGRMPRTTFARPPCSRKQQSIRQLSGRFLPKMDCIMEWKRGGKKKNEWWFVAFLPFTAGQVAADSKAGSDKWIGSGGREGKREKESKHSLMAVRVSLAVRVTAWSVCHNSQPGVRHHRCWLPAKLLSRHSTQTLHPGLVIHKHTNNHWQRMCQCLHLRFPCLTVPWDQYLPNIPSNTQDTARFSKLIPSVLTYSDVFLCKNAIGKMGLNCFTVHKYIRKSLHL